MRLSLALAFALASLTSALAIAPAPAERIPAGGRFLCSQHVTGTNVHIAWRSFAFTRTVAELRAEYATRGITFTQQGDDLVHAPNDSFRLSIHPANGSYPSCEQRPNANERSVIVLSNATR